MAIVQPDAFPTELNVRVTGADDASRMAAYEPLRKRSEALFAQIGDLARSRSPQLVADAIVRLANLPAGRRPLRTSVPAYHPADELNAAASTIQHELLAAFGLDDFLQAAGTI